MNLFPDDEFCKHIPLLQKGDISKEAVCDLLNDIKPELIITATSQDPHSIDKITHSIAKEWGIICVSILDYWCNYIERYSQIDPFVKLKYLPDYIFVMDRFAKIDMLREGFPPERLVVTGHPYFSWLYNNRKMLGDDQKVKLKSKLGLKGKRVICFISEPSEYLKFDNRYRFSKPTAGGERTTVVLQSFLDILQEIFVGNGSNITVVNRLHPKNSLSDFRWIDYSKYNFEIKHYEATEIDKHDMIQISTLIVGMTSSLLLESIIYDIPTLSIIPKASEENILISNRYGKEYMARTPMELKNFMMNWFHSFNSTTKWKFFRRKVLSVVCRNNCAIDKIMRITDGC
ncbi:MAG: hypothetical protein CMM60_04945 [Rhodospirillaceae bacterium]|nr:hypothetical protein [Rhodospirillaceae bacterium]